jgi:FemAB-related protein (PEP-CTERM system-associated)
VQIQSTAAAPPEWDAYVAAHPSTTAYHKAAAVAVGTSAFGLRSTYIFARDASGRLLGVLPIVEQSSVLFGRFHVSVPFFTYGGVLADDPQISSALVVHASELARSRRAAHLELRHTAHLPELGLSERNDKVSMVLPLPESEAALGKQLGSKLRSQVRRAERERPEIVWGGAELVPDFYRVFAPVMHELGTPVYPLRFFQETCRALKDCLSIIAIRVRARTEAAAVLVRHGERIEVPWAAASASAKSSAINMRLYWEMLHESVRRGAHAFDFGRSTRDSGTFRFKAQWGAQPWQLHWHYWLRSGGELPQLNHSNPKYQLAAALWRKMPLWCANRLGPHIVRNLP